jgi:hypothetical protein
MVYQTIDDEKKAVFNVPAEGKNRRIERLKIQFEWMEFQSDWTEFQSYWTEF